jgi:transcriptional regulator of arginine metabolism
MHIEGTGCEQPLSERTSNETMPTDSEYRAHRQEQILRLLKEGVQVSSQEQIVELLREQGIPATQSSVSRDLRDMGVYRYGRYYLLPSNPEPDAETAQRELAERANFFLVDLRSAGPNLLVVETQTGAAQTLAIAIESVKWAEVVGTIAGDDTIFIATPGMIEQRRIIERLKKHLTER